MSDAYSGSATLNLSDPATPTSWKTTSDPCLRAFRLGAHDAQRVGRLGAEHDAACAGVEERLDVHEARFLHRAAAPRLGRAPQQHVDPRLIERRRLHAVDVGGEGDARTNDEGDKR
jgi:hypothetical protein